MQLHEANIGIIGLGQMGGSLAMALKRAFPNIVITACDLRDDLCRIGRERGHVDVIAVAADDVIDHSNIVVIALPVLAISEVLRKNCETLREKLLVTDTGSLKGDIMKMASICELDTFVGGHPLAGTELRGPESWNGDLFRGANYFVTSDFSTNIESLMLADQLIRTLGSCKVAIAPDTHDKIFSISSNLPHLLAFLLKSQLERQGSDNAPLEKFACPSYRGATRVASSDAEMVFQMLWGNREHFGNSLRELRTNLEWAQKALDSGAEMEFRRIFRLK